jgi:hypothetical protein
MNLYLIRSAAIGAVISLFALEDVAFAQSTPLGSIRRDADINADYTGLIGPENAALFANQISHDLAERGARVPIVFRSGRSREDLPDGIRYTHGAFWVYQPMRDVEGKLFNGYAVYNLYAPNDGEGAEGDGSYLFQDFAIDFTLPMSVEEAGIIIPTPGVQERIFNVMASPTY